MPNTLAKFGLLHIDGIKPDIFRVLADKTDMQPEGLVIRRKSHIARPLDSYSQPRLVDYCGAGPGIPGNSPAPLVGYFLPQMTVSTEPLGIHISRCSRPASENG